MNNIISALVFVSLVGCIPAKSTTLNMASDEFACDKSDLTVSQRSNETYVVTGCDRQGVYQCDVAGRDCVNLALMARERGARSFECPFEKITVEELSPYVFRVRGCDSSENYYCHGDSGRARCFLESEQCRGRVATPRKAKPTPTPVQSQPAG